MSVTEQFSASFYCDELCVLDYTPLYVQLVTDVCLCIETLKC